MVSTKVWQNDKVVLEKYDVLIENSDVLIEKYDVLIENSEII